MVPALLIVKVGTTLPEIHYRRGDFEQWFCTQGGWKPSEVTVVSPYRGEALPHFDAFEAVVVTGSAALVTERLPWSEQTAEWLASVARHGIPLLAVCYGHQLLAHALGGTVQRNNAGREIGTVTVQTTVEALQDALFGALPSQLVVQATHVETVATLPERAVRLAYNDKDPHQAFRYGDRAWGMQFHPEFDAGIIEGYIRGRASALVTEGVAPEALAKQCRDSPHGARLLQRFRQLSHELASQR